MEEYTSFYRFFDVTLAFSTNAKWIQDDFHRIYGYFAASTLTNPDIICSLYEKNGFILSSKSKHYSTNYSINGNIGVDTYFSLFSPVFFETKSTLLIHSGSLISPNNKSLIICAPSGFGKSTLSESLLSEGFSFMSDELAPLNLSNGTIYPFPRAMGIIKNNKKEIQDIPKKIGASTKPNTIFFLSLEKEEENPSSRYLEIALGRIDNNIIEDFKEIDGINNVTLLDDRMFPMLRVSLEKNTYIADHIQRIANQNSTPILYTLKGKTKPPDFNATPQLSAMSPKEGIFEISQNILNIHDSALLEEVFSNSRGKIIFELARLLEGVHFYKLTVGKLDKMISLTKGLF